MERVKSTLLKTEPHALEHIYRQTKNIRTKTGNYYLVNTLLKIVSIEYVFIQSVKSYIQILVFNRFIHSFIQFNSAHSLRIKMVGYQKL